MIDFSSVVGIDVSKASLDVAFGLTEPVQNFPNEPKGHKALARALAKRGPSRIIMEATGGYEHALLRYLTDKNLPAIRVSPRPVRQFAGATNILAKTDAIDARVLVRFGATLEPQHRPLPSREQERIASLQTRRSQLISFRTMEKNRVQQVTNAFVVRTIRKMIKDLNTQIKLLEQESLEVIQEHQKLQRTFDVLTSVPGVGPVVAAVLVGSMPELGTLSRQAVASLAGLAPFNHDSGTQRGQRHIRGGRTAVRSTLYMGALTAVRCNPVLEEDFDRMIKANKPAKVALTACMRKLLTILNALVRDDVFWGEKKSPNIPKAP